MIYDVFVMECGVKWGNGEGAIGIGGESKNKSS